MTPKIVGAAWENGNRGTPWRGPLRKPGLASSRVARRRNALAAAAARRGSTLTAAIAHRGNALTAAIAIAALLAGCGIQPTDVIVGLEAPSGPVENASPSLYWVSEGKVVPAGRPAGGLSGFDVVALLAQGPTNAEQTRGLTSEVPFDAAPATVDRVANGLDVNLSTDVSLLSDAAVQQIVCTLLGIQAVGTVNLRGGGRSLEFVKCA